MADPLISHLQRLTVLAGTTRDRVVHLGVLFLAYAPLAALAAALLGLVLRFGAPTADTPWHLSVAVIRADCAGAANHVAGTGSSSVSDTAA